jgi:hypothetical protein
MRRAAPELHGGVDAVVHLAAIPGASHSANAVTFTKNVPGVCGKRDDHQARLGVGCRRASLNAGE